METSAAPSDTLAPRERAIVRSRGQTNRAIGEKLFISERTVDSHASRIFRKPDVRTPAEAIAVGSAPDWVVAAQSAPVGQQTHISKNRQAEPSGIPEPNDPQRT
jgi:DNA-binding CsgD family transcriptional regulator